VLRAGDTLVWWKAGFAAPAPQPARLSSAGGARALPAASLAASSF